MLFQLVPVADLLRVLQRATPGPMVLVLGASLAALYTRALRWQVLFQPEHRVALGPAFGTLAISYMASTFLPFRAGELVRAVFLSRREQIPIARVVGTILIEKLFDFLALAVLLAWLVASTPLPREAAIAGASVASVIVLGFGFVVALALWREPTLRMVGRLEGFLPAGLRRRVSPRHAVEQFAGGTDSLRVGRLWLQLLLWTVVTWAASIVGMIAGLEAIDARASFAAAIFTIVATSVSQAVPSSPGYVGVFHAAAVAALTFFGIDTATAFGAAVLIHALNYGFMVVLGLIALWVGGYALGDVMGARRAMQQPPANPRPAPAETSVR
ncbi:MAG: flippase-like domain-containing protein [Chloroflexi bacterium]|nr:flippase-like domain-containing protein [Chloroflexota bacterium]